VTSGDFKSDFEIIGPSVGQFIKSETDHLEIEAMIKPLMLETKKLILIPVSNADEDHPEGSHWSLLILFANFPRGSILRKMLNIDENS
jgi:hypothetical protein